MKARQKRMLFVALGILGVGVASMLAISALRSNIAYFFSPSQVLANEAPANAVYRLGGLVVKDSLAREEDGLTVTFDVTAQTTNAQIGVLGSIPVLFEDYGIDNPSFGAISTEDDGLVEFVLVFDRA